MRSSAYKEKDAVSGAKQALENGKAIVFFDLETTGLSKVTDRILSFSAIKIMKQGGKLEEVDRIDLFINPGFHIPDNITAINHIDDAKVANCPREPEAAAIIRAFFGESPVVSGYNSASFDEGFVQELYRRNFGEDFTPELHVDVFRMAKEKLELKSYKLGCVSESLGAAVGLEFHNSIDDVIATFRSFEILMDMYDDEEEECLRIIKVKGASYWNGPNHTLQRIYVKTYPYTKTFYDIYRKEWVSDKNDVDLDAIRKDTLQMYGANNEAELASALAS